MHDVIVIGAGVAGLAAAERVLRARLDVVCLDGATAPGGVTSTRVVDGFQFEQGPSTVHCRAPEFAALLAELSGELRTVAVDPERAARRYVLHGGRLHAVPARPGALVRSPLVGLAGTLRLARGMALSRRPAPAPGAASSSGAEAGSATVDAVVRRRFGPRVADNLVSALTVGVFGVESDELEARTALPFLAELDDGGRSPLLGLARRRRAARAAGRSGGGGAGHARGAAAAPSPAPAAGMITFEGGLGALPRALAARLGPRLVLGERAVQLERSAGAWRATTSSGRSFGARRVVLAIDARTTAELLRPLTDAEGRPAGAQVAAELAAVDSVSLAVLNLGFRAASFAAPLDGYGFLVARSDRAERVLGVLYSSCVFPHQAPEGHVAVRAFFGGSRHPSLALASEGELVVSALDVLRRCAGLYPGGMGAPVAIDLARWPGAVPVYRPGHAARVERLRAAAQRLAGLTLAGTFLDGIGVNDCVARGVRAAEAIVAERTK